VPLWRVHLHLSYHFLSATFFQPLNLPFYCPLIIFVSPLYKVSSYSITSLGIGTRANAEKVELKYGQAFESPLLLSLSLFSIILSLLFVC
jgi:hypothetical protein